MRQVGMFAKYWTPGAVKTRLAAGVGEIAASRIYRGFVVALLERLDGLGDRQTLAFAPPEYVEQFARVAGGWVLQPQAAGDLGQRMNDYFNRAFAGGASAAVLLGSDSPNVPGAYVSQALALLNAHDLVLGPTPDGGYYLIGARPPTPDVFAGVQWSSPRVWEQTVANAKRAELSLGVLPPWYDVDDLDDLRRLLSELAETQDPALVHLRELIVRETAFEE